MQYCRKLIREENGVRAVVVLESGSKHDISVGDRVVLVGMKGVTYEFSRGVYRRCMGVWMYVRKNMYACVWV